MPTDGPQGADWDALLAAPRRRNAVLARSDIPTAPGVYAWFQGGSCVYVGKAANLRRRVSSHRSASRDLSRSTLRASVAAAELGIPRGEARRRPSMMTPSQIAVVTAWFHNAELTWTECPDPGLAAERERRLRAVWLPPLNRI